MTWPADRADDDYCYLTTNGRRTGRAHEIEIWFALEDGVVYLLSGGGRRSDWVRNLEADPSVTLRLGETSRPGSARVVEDPAEDALARRLLPEKYAPRYRGSLERWSREGLPIAVDPA